MAKLIRRGEDRYVLVNEQGQYLGKLYRPYRRTGYRRWHFSAFGELVNSCEFVTIDECLRWLQDGQGLQVELIETE